MHCKVKKIFFQSNNFLIVLNCVSGVLKRLGDGVIRLSATCIAFPVFLLDIDGFVKVHFVHAVVVKCNTFCISN